MSLECGFRGLGLRGTKGFTSELRSQAGSGSGLSGVYHVLKGLGL